MWCFFSKWGLGTMFCVVVEYTRPQALNRAAFRGLRLPNVLEGQRRLPERALSSPDTLGSQPRSHQRRTVSSAGSELPSLIRRLGHSCLVWVGRRLLWDSTPKSKTPRLLCSVLGSLLGVSIILALGAHAAVLDYLQWVHLLLKCSGGESLNWDLPVRV